MNGTEKHATYTVEQIERRLGAELPGWQHRGDSICRTYRTTGWKATLMVVNAVGYLCEVGWHHPDLDVSYNKVAVRLRSHDVEGITDRDFELAARIDEVIGWAPENAAGALTGAPVRQRVLSSGDAE